MLDESEIYATGPLAGVSILDKHVAEDGWIPKEETLRAQQIIEALRCGEIQCQIVFSHGMVIAAVVKELNRQGASYDFDEERGFVPLQASITPISM